MFFKYIKLYFNICYVYFIYILLWFIIYIYCILVTLILLRNWIIYSCFLILMTFVWNCENRSHIINYLIVIFVEFKLLNISL